MYITREKALARLEINIIKSSIIKTNSKKYLRKNDITGKLCI
jgi:hypothetical protein